LKKSDEFLLSTDVIQLVQELIKPETDAGIDIKAYVPRNGEGKKRGSCDPLQTVSRSRISAPFVPKSRLPAIPVSKPRISAASASKHGSDRYLYEKSVEQLRLSYNYYHFGRKYGEMPECVDNATTVRILCSDQNLTTH